MAPDNNDPPSGEDKTLSADNDSGVSVEDALPEVEVLGDGTGGDSGGAGKSGGGGLVFTILVVIVVLGVFLAAEMKMFDGLFVDETPVAPGPGPGTGPANGNGTGTVTGNGNNGGGDGTVKVPGSGGGSKPSEVARLDPVRAPADPFLQPVHKGRDGKTMRLIPAGSFIMGDTESEKATPQRLVSMEAYYMDETEVTFAEYSSFIAAGGYYRSELWSEDGWNWRLAEQRDSPGEFLRVIYAHGKSASYTVSNINSEFHYYDRSSGRPSLMRTRALQDPEKWRIVEVQPMAVNEGYTLQTPVTMVSFWEAEAYAKWVGKEIPTEAQWEKAARGDADRRLYVFDETVMGARQRSLDVLQTLAAFGNDRPVVGGTHPQDKSAFGILDMTGSVNEWCRDFWDFDAFRKTPLRVTNPVVTVPVQAHRYDRVVKGGSFKSDKPEEALVSDRRFSNQSDRKDSRGFRCVVRAADLDNTK